MRGRPVSSAFAFLFVFLASRANATAICSARHGRSWHLSGCSSLPGEISVAHGPLTFLTAAPARFYAGAASHHARSLVRKAPSTCKYVSALRSPQIRHRGTSRRLAVGAFEVSEAHEQADQLQQKPSVASRILGTGCYILPLIDALQAFAPVPTLGLIAGRVAWWCNIASMGASFLVLRKKLLPAPPFVKHHLMTASLLSMCCFTLANIHYKVTSFFISGKVALQEYLAFAAGASLFSLICPAAVSAAKGRPATLPVLSEAVALHLGPDNFVIPHTREASFTEV